MKLLKPGDRLPDGLLKPARIRQLIEKGVLVDSTEVLKKTQKLVEDNETASGTRSSVFAINPKDLKSKALSTLNAMLVERGATPVDSKDEAIQILSADFNDSESDA